MKKFFVLVVLLVPCLSLVSLDLGVGLDMELWAASEKEGSFEANRIWLRLWLNCPKTSVNRSEFATLGPSLISKTAIEVPAPPHRGASRRRVTGVFYTTRSTTTIVGLGDPGRRVGSLDSRRRVSQNFECREHARASNRPAAGRQGSRPPRAGQ